MSLKQTQGCSTSKFDPWQFCSRVLMLRHHHPHWPLLSAKDRLPLLPVLRAPSDSCCHSLRSPLLRSFLRCHLLKDSFPSYSFKVVHVCTHAHTRTTLCHCSLCLLPFSVSLLCPYHHLHLACLFVCMSLESRDFTYFIVEPSGSRTAPVHSSTR